MSESTRVNSGARRRLLGLGVSEWLLAVTILVMVGLPVHEYRAQQASRYLLTAAIVEERSIKLDRYVDVLGIDRAVRDGHTYSDKAPGQPLLAIPFFAIGRAVGVEDPRILRVEGNLGLWWVTLWSAAIPGAMLAVLMFRRARLEDPRRALGVTLAVFAGTLLLPFSALLFGHVLAALLLYVSYLLLGGDSRWPRLMAAGLAAGSAVAVEYTAVLGVIVLAVYAAARHGKSVVAWVAGGVPVALALGAYNAVAFGSPFTLSYQFSSFEGVTEQSRPLLAMFDTLASGNVVRLFVDGRGLLIATPLVVVGIVAAIHGIRREDRGEATLALAMMALFLLLPVFWGNPWGGDSPGARYITPGLPFLVLPVVWAWKWWPRLTLAATLVSVATMVSATFTNPLIDRFSFGGLGTWARFAVRGETVDTLMTLALGKWAGWLAHLGLLFVLGWMLFWSASLEGNQQRSAG